jgi:hypothetical protein
VVAVADEVTADDPEFTAIIATATRARTLPIFLAPNST